MGMGSSWGIGNRESGIGNRESGIGNRESGIVRASGSPRDDSTAWSFGPHGAMRLPARPCALRFFSTCGAAA
ncbi:hypothetical protein DFG55_06650 [Xanthomonas campestris pv. campestris]|nr:hypothetical protein DFG55_06650 [Xanthomonas campestris pv. campestris]QCX69502.1 hypothetical protein DFG54_00720 [Xanthomonas campestris pv. campestris]